MSTAPDIIIRRCGEEDAALLSLIGGASFLDGFYDFTPGQDIAAHVTEQHSVNRYADYLGDANNAAWMAVHKRTDAPVGYLLCTIPDLPLETDAADWELKRIYLLSRFQGSGLATDFVKLAVDEGRLRDKKRLLLGVNEDNDRAIRFYKKSGFVVVGERHFSIGSQRYGDVVMGLNL